MRFVQTTIRAAIMLGVLVGLPGAWLYYGPLPPQAQRVADRFVAAAKDAVGWKVETNGADQPAQDAGSPPRVDARRLPTGQLGVVAQPVAVKSPGSSISKPGGALAERVEPLLSRLRSLGALEYSLENWGSDRRLFRFHCEMPLGSGKQATEQFESIAADPAQSIARVVADVTSWQSTRLASNLASTGR